MIKILAIWNRVRTFFFNFGQTQRSAPTQIFNINIYLGYDVFSRSKDGLTKMFVRILDELTA